MTNVAQNRTRTGAAPDEVPDYLRRHELEMERRRLEAERASIWRARENVLRNACLTETIECDLSFYFDRPDDRDELTATKMLASVQAWMGRNDVAPVLILSGGPGVGKTVAAAWALASMASSAHADDFVKASTIARWFSAQFGEMVEWAEAAKRRPLLIVDDVGAEADPIQMSAALLELIDARQHSALRNRTILTTNLSPKAFANRYPDPRLASRMAPQFGAVRWCVASGPDLRRRPRTEEA